MGGLLMGALWQGWLLTHGTWYDYWHNSAEYRNDFYAATDGFEHRTTGLFLNKFKPWGLFHVLAVPVALAALGRGLWLRSSSLLAANSLLAAFSLGWLGQATYLQSQLDYHLAPTVLLALTLLAGWVSQRSWRTVGWIGLATAVALAVSEQSSVRPNRLALWANCWHESSASLKDKLSLMPGPHRPHWTDLERVADYLREQGVGDHQLICYNSTTMPLYLVLQVRPATRFLYSAIYLSDFRVHRQALQLEMKTGPQRYIITDSQAPRCDGEQWPFTEPIVFRAGSYCVHRVQTAQASGVDGL